MSLSKRETPVSLGLGHEQMRPDAPRDPAGQAFGRGDPNAAGDSPGRYPDFLIIGAARAGTTTLATHLTRHPQIFMCDPKEPFFFSHEAIYARGPGWYCGLFARCGKNQICGEASTSYSVWPQCGDVAGRIAKAIPSAKLIYILRQPVDRAYSHYDYEMTRLRMRMTFEEALVHNPQFLSASLYMQQIKQYLRYFDRRFLLCLLLDDLALRRDETLAKLWSFLGVAAIEPLERPCLENSADEHFVRMQTTQRLRQIPGLSRLADRIPRSWRNTAFGMLKGSPLYRWIARGHKLPPMRPETRQRLLHIFQQPNAELAEFLQRDLSAWSAEAAPGTLGRPW